MYKLAAALSITLSELINEIEEVDANRQYLIEITKEAEEIKAIIKNKR